MEKLSGLADVAWPLIHAYTWCVERNADYTLILTFQHIYDFKSIRGWCALSLALFEVGDGPSLRYKYGLGPLLTE